MSVPTAHPLVEAYLRDLELLLRGVDLGERAEVLAGVREHLEARLGTDTSEDAVRAALAELGPPQAIADEAYGARTAAPVLPARRPPSPWQAVVACSLNALGLALVALLLLTGLAGAMELLYSGLTVFALPWSGVFALSLLAPVWTRRQRMASALFFPAVIVAFTAVVGIMSAVLGPSVFNLIPAVALFAVAVWVLVRLLKAALR